MSKSYKGEARAQARANQQRRAARAAKRNANENDSHLGGTKHPVDASPSAKQRWTVGWRG
jgi:hypothetical protein